MKKKKSSNLVTISIITVITLFIWIGIEGFERLTKKDLKTVPPEILNPLTPTLDKAVFETIKSKKSLSSQELATLKPKHLRESAPSSVNLEQAEEETPVEVAPEATGSANIDQNTTTQQGQ